MGRGRGWKKHRRRSSSNKSSGSRVEPKRHLDEVTKSTDTRNLKEAEKQIDKRKTSVPSEPIKPPETGAKKPSVSASPAAPAVPPQEVDKKPAGGPPPQDKRKKSSAEKKEEIKGDDKKGDEKKKGDDKKGDEKRDSRLGSIFHASPVAKGDKKDLSTRAERRASYREEKKSLLRKVSDTLSRPFRRKAKPPKVPSEAEKEKVREARRKSRAEAHPPKSPKGPDSMSGDEWYHGLDWVRKNLGSSKSQSIEK